MNYDQLKKEFGNWASWAWWDPDDINTPPDDQTKKNPKYVFVGLNASQAKDGKPWGNFHCKHRGGKDHNLRDALMGTKFEGAYLTDILKHPDEPKSQDVDRHFKNNPQELTTHFDRFKKEIELLEEVEMVYVFGYLANKYVKYGEIDDWLKSKGIGIIPLTHYSAPSMYKSGAFREYIQDTI